jgi:hypothetical protein
MPTGTPTITPTQTSTLVPGQAYLVVSPSSAELVIGDTFAIEVRVESVRNLYGVDIRLSFDPAKVEVQDANPGTAGVQIEPGPFLDVTQGFVAQNSADNTAGRINYAMALLSPAEPKSGSGTLVRITFKGISQGDSPISFLSAVLSDHDGLPIDVGTSDGMLRVRQPGTPTASATPTGTATATSPTPIRTTVVVTPAAVAVGYFRSDDTTAGGNRLGGTEIWAGYGIVSGFYRLYQGAIQFDIPTAIPSQARIEGLEVTVKGKSHKRSFQG